ncbi:MAG: magnetochrome domain-containing protein [Rhodospirillales bacterium]
MAPFKRFRSLFGGKGVVVLLAALLLAGLAWEALGGWDDLRGPSKLFVRTVEGLTLGKFPDPVESGVIETVKMTLIPEKRYRLMTIRHIPRINIGAAQPHPYVGACTQCHLYRGGAGPGSQPKTPVGAALESLSRIKKLGPPLRPNTQMLHPPAGRCIKCHNIVVKVPVEQKKGGPLWVM